MTPALSRTVLRSLLVAATLMLAACQQAPWTRIDAPAAIPLKDSDLAIQPPADWIRWNGAPNAVVITRDGTPIQFIRAVEMSHAQAFRSIKKTSDADLLPNELAELLIAARKAMPGMSGLVVRSNAPASFGGLDGVRLDLAYRDERGASFEQLVYAAARPASVFVIEYQALSKHYFARDLPTFEAVVASVAVTPGKK